MEKRNRQKEQELHNERLRFYTNIAHELRTPLTLIIGPLEDLRITKAYPPLSVQNTDHIPQCRATAQSYQPTDGIPQDRNSKQTTDCG